MPDVSEREGCGMAHIRSPSIEHQRRGFAAVALHRLRGHDMKVMAQEVFAFGAAFALSLAVSVVVVELIWSLT
jgi:hypothetical protein